MANAGMELFELAMKITESGTSQLLTSLNLIDQKGKATNKTLGEIGSTLKTIGAALVVSATAGLLFEMGKAAAEDETSIVSLQSSVEAVGISFQKWSPYMEQVIADLFQLSGVADEQLRAALARLIEVTGNVRGSVQNLSLVLDISRKRHIELNEAANLVGKVMNGNVTPVFRQLGIHVTNSADAMQVLRERFGGFTGKDADTLAGAFTKMKGNFLELIENLGTAAFNTAGFKGMLNGLTTAFQNGQKWVLSHKAAISDLTQALIHLGKFVWDNVLSPFFKFMYQGFQGLRILFIEFEEGIKQIPENFKRAFGDTIAQMGNFVEQFAKIADIIPGVHLQQKVNETLTQMGIRMRDQAQQNIDALQKNAQTAIDNIRRVSQAGSEEVAKTPARVGMPEGGGPRAKAFDIEQVKEQVAILKTLIEMGHALPQTGAALTQLNEILTRQANLTDDLKTKAQILGIAKDAQEAFQKFMAPDMAVMRALKPQSKTDIQRALEQVPGVGAMFNPDAETVAAERLQEFHQHIAEMLQDQVATGIGQSLVSAFGEAFSGKGIAGFFTAFTKTILGYFGNMLIELGLAFLKFGKIMSALQKFLTNIFTAGPASVAIGIALIALGAAFSSIASRGGGSSSGGGGGSPYAFPGGGGPGGAGDYTRVTVGPTSAQNGSKAQPAPNITNVYYGIDDPRGQRAIVTMYDRGKGRGIKG